MLQKQNFFYSNCNVVYAYPYFIDYAYAQNQKELFDMLCKSKAVKTGLVSDIFDAGIMISASHNPYYDNGIKVMNGNGEKLDDDAGVDVRGDGQCKDG